MKRGMLGNILGTTDTEKPFCKGTGPTQSRREVTDAEPAA
jgi:hypothetical protein